MCSITYLKHNSQPYFTRKITKLLKFIKIIDFEEKLASKILIHFLS